MNTPTVITLPLSTFENMKMEQTWRLDDCLDQARQAWRFFKWYKNYLMTEEFPETSFPLLLHSTCQHIQTIHQQNVDLLWSSFFLIIPWWIPPFDFLWTFSTSSGPGNEFCSGDRIFLVSTVLLRQYLFLSHNLKRIWQDLIQHQQERESIFGILSHSALFQDIITPIILDFRFWQWQVSPVNPPPTFQTSSLNSPISEQVVERQSVIIQERSNSTDSLLSFYTAAHEEPGMRNNPINVDRLLDPSPSPPRIPVYTPPRTRSAPITAPCQMCRQHGHTSTQCVWYGPGICSYCEEVGHTVHNCSILHWDQQRFNPHLLYCLMCKQSGHTLNTCSTLPSYQ